MHGSLLKDTHFVAKEPQKLNNAINTCLINPEYYFILFLTIKYL